MANQLDEIDRRIIYAVMDDARHASPPDLANELDVTAATIRNRITNLEAEQIITGYHAAIDFEAADGSLTNLYLCNAPVAERESFASKVKAVPGVINVRELMTGRRNLHVLAIGEDIHDLRRIARAISSLGIEIEDEDLVQSETSLPYAPYGPDKRERHKTLSDFITLAGGSEIVEVTVGERAKITGKTLSEAGGIGILGDDTLVIAIERDGLLLTPKGSTDIQTDDVVTVFSRGGIEDDTLDAISGTPK